MKFAIVIILFASALCYSCNQPQTPEERKVALEENVLAIHDSAMAKMDDIYHLRRNLRALRDTLETQPKPDSTTLKLLQTHILLLNRADESMMGWMRQYKAPVEMNNEQATNYLNQELVKIMRVQEVMDSTINAARSTYKKYDDRNK
jgi:hypothetical protein